MARSSELAPHIGRLSRSQVFAKRGNFKGQSSSRASSVATDYPVLTMYESCMTAGKKTSTPKAKEETPAFTEKTIGGKANGEKRLVPTNKASKYYPVRPFPTSPPP